MPNSIHFLNTVPTASALRWSAGRRVLSAVKAVKKVTLLGTTSFSLIISLYVVTNTCNASRCSMESLSVYAQALITAV